MYAVVPLQWHQFIVKKWDTIVVDLLDADAWSSVEFDNALMVFSEDAETVSVWAPYVSWASIKATVKSHQKWKKLRVLKFQWKKRYQRIKWFRPKQTVLSIDDIIYG